MHEYQQVNLHLDGISILEIRGHCFVIKSDNEIMPFDFMFHLLHEVSWDPPASAAFAPGDSS